MLIGEHFINDWTDWSKEEKVAAGINPPVVAVTAEWNALPATHITLSNLVFPIIFSQLDAKIKISEHISGNYF